MKAREYEVLEIAVEQGVNYGWNRSRKHDPAPSDEAARHAIQSAVLNSICEWFIFSEDRPDD